MSKSLTNLCSVKYEDFKSIFDDFFIIRSINKDTLLDKLDKKEIYNNFNINKIEIKQWIWFEEFVDKLLTHLNKYYYDWDKEKTKTSKHLEKAKQRLNQYTVKRWQIFSTFEVTEFHIEGKVYNWKFLYENYEKEKSFKNAIINYLKEKELKLSDFENLDSNEKYIVLWKNDKVMINSKRQAFSYLHWDIWEFILFFLTEWLLWAPILFSKIRHSKSAAWDKIKWSDWVHINYSEKWNYKIKHLFLESKYNKNFSDSISQAIDSQKEFIENKWTGTFDNELFILDANIDTIDKLYWEIFINWYEDFLNPYYLWEKWIDSFEYDLVTWLIYQSDIYSNLINSEIGINDFIEKSTLKNIDEVLKNYKKIEKGLKNRCVNIFLLPVIDEVELIKVFLSKIEK